MNPILPRNYYIPDVEARVWGDGRIYLYGSMDIESNTGYCSQKYHVFSSDNMIDWTDHGRSFDFERSHSDKGGWLFAPDCICKDGTYYLLYCGNDASEGFAISTKPEGPFGPGTPIAGADGDAIDPGALVDDDGAIYYFWGQYGLQRKNGGPC